MDFMQSGYFPESIYALHVSQTTVRPYRVSTAEGLLVNPDAQSLGQTPGGSTDPDGDSPHDTVLTVRAACPMFPLDTPMSGGPAQSRGSNRACTIGGCPPHLCRHRVA